MTEATVSLKDQLQLDLTSAMKARNEVALSTLRMLRAAILNAEVAGTTPVALDDEAVQAILKSEAKKRHESAELYEGAGRTELASKERAELEIINQYLPAAMNDEELVGLVDAEVAAAASAGVTGPKAMGQVVKAVRDRAGSSADGARIAALVKERLVR
jgi:uncharacterized protein YqeY